MTRPPPAQPLWEGLRDAFADRRGGHNDSADPSPGDQQPGRGRKALPAEPTSPPKSSPGRKREKKRERGHRVFKISRSQQKANQAMSPPRISVVDGVRGIPRGVPPPERVTKFRRLAISCSLFIAAVPVRSKFHKFQDVRTCLEKEDLSTTAIAAGSAARRHERHANAAKTIVRPSVPANPAPPNELTQDESAPGPGQPGSAS